jgi:hypothetical protein
LVAPISPAPHPAPPAVRGPNSAAIIVLGRLSLRDREGRTHDLESAAVPGPRSCHRTAYRGRAAETPAWAVQHPDAAQVRTASAAINPARGAAPSCRRRQARPCGAGTLTRILGSQQSGIAIGFSARSDPRRRAGTPASVVSSRSGIGSGLPPCSGPRLIRRDSGLRCTPAGLRAGASSQIEALTSCIQL